MVGAAACVALALWLSWGFAVSERVAARATAAAAARATSDRGR